MRMVVIPRFKGCNMQANERNRGLATIPFDAPFVISPEFGAANLPPVSR